MFGKSRSDKSNAQGDSTAVKNDEVRVVNNASEAKKGRPTPTRKEAEQARKAALQSNKITTSTKGMDKKSAKKAERDAMREERVRTREALMRGDESAMPKRDRGPVRRTVRNFVDSRRTVAEYFVPVAVVVLLLGMTRNFSLQIVVTYVWIAIIVLVVADTGYMMFKMNKKLAQEFPDKADRKGVTFYAIMRAMQIRRLRLPPPQFKAGGKRVEPKVKK